MFGFGYPIYTFGLTLNLPIRNRSASANYADTVVSKRSDALTTRRTEQQVRLDVLNAISQTQAAKDSVRLAKVAKDFSQKYLDAEQKKYELGTSHDLLRPAGPERAGQRRFDDGAKRDHLPAQYAEPAAQDRRTAGRARNHDTVGKCAG